MLSKFGAERVKFLTKQKNARTAARRAGRKKSGENSPDFLSHVPFEGAAVPVHQGTQAAAVAGGDI